MLFFFFFLAPADTMQAPPGSQTQGEVHLTDNPADLDVITTGREHTARSVSTKKIKNKHTHTHNRQLLGNATASDER